MISRPSEACRRRLTVIRISIGLLPLVSLAQPVGSVRGFIVDDAGQPLAGITVALQARSLSSPPPQTGVVAFNTGTQTGPTGSFTFDRVPPGTYEVCAYPSTGDFLSPCIWTAWGPNRNLVTVKASSATSVPSITVKKGVRFRVRVLDPAGDLDRDEPLPNSKLRLLVGVPGVGYAPLTLFQKSKSERVYEMLVPPATPLKIAIASKDFDVADAGGARLDAANGHRLEIPEARSDSPILLTAVKTKKTN